MSPYIAYYDNQAGGGAVEKFSNFGRVYVGSPYQRGHGIGAFLGGLFRRILPFFGSAARTVGKEALHAGLNVMGDVVSNKVPFKVALENRLSESGLKLKRKAAEKIGTMMQGSGYKRKRRRRTAHKLVGRGSVNTSKKRKYKKKKQNSSSSKKSKKNKSKSQTRDLYDIFK